MHEAHLRVPCPDDATARLLRQAVSVEAEEGPAGADSTIQAEGADVTVHIRAADISSMRAATNGVLRLLDAALRTIR